MLEVVEADLIARVWAHTAGEVGGYEGMGEPVVLPADDVTIVDIPLYFEAGDRSGRASSTRRPGHRPVHPPGPRNSPVTALYQGVIATMTIQRIPLLALTAGLRSPSR